MFRKTVSAIMMFSLVMSTLALAFKIQPVKADGGTIYINADGSITPSTAPIYTADNITYTLTGNITATADGIVIERDSIVVDGAGYAVVGSGSGNGITFAGGSNVTLKNTQIRAFYIGIWLNYSSDCTVSENNITENGYGGGISIRYSLNNIVYGNNITDTQGDGILLELASGNNVTCNNIRTNMTNDGWGMGVASSSNNILSERARLQSGPYILYD